MQVRVSSAFLLIAAATCAAQPNPPLIPRFLVQRGFDPFNQSVVTPVGWQDTIEMQAMVIVATTDHQTGRTLEQHARYKAKLAADEIMARCYDPVVSKRSLNPSNVALFMYKFLDCDIDGMVCLRSSGDMTESDPVLWAQICNSSGCAATETMVRQLHPWMTQTRVRTREWMLAFCGELARLHSLDHYDGYSQKLPLPRAVIFDAEKPLYDHATELVYSLKCATNDTRWASADVPGFPAGVTMAQLWSDFAIEHGLNNPIGAAFVPNAPGFSGNNPQVSGWYRTTTSNVLDAIFDEVAYSVIRGMLSPTIMCSNYAIQWADGEPDVGEWRETTNATQKPLLAHLPRFATNLMLRDVILTSDLGGWDLNTPGGRFSHLHKQTARGGWSSPRFYPVAVWANPANPYTDHHAQLNQYLPADPPEPLLRHPIETPLESLTRVNRHNLEVAINSIPTGKVTPAGSESVAPWVPLVGEVMEVQAAPGPVVITERHVATALMVIRGLDIPNVLLFEAAAARSGGPSMFKWSQTLAVIRRIYAPFINNIDVSKGFSYPLPVDVRRLETSRRDGNAGMTTPAVVTISSVPSSSEAGPIDATWMDVDFGGLQKFTTPSTLLLRFECTVSPQLTCELSNHPVEGEVFAYSWSSMDWQQLSFQDWEYDHQSCLGCYGFYTNSMETRRIVDFANFPWTQFVSTNGTMRLRFVHKSTTGCFTSVYNIAQVVQLGNYLLPDSVGVDPTPEADAGVVGELRAGDYNGSGETTIEDFVQFMDDYSAGASAADVTGDAAVGNEDAAAFLDYYVESVP